MDDGREQVESCCDPLDVTQHTRVRARVPLACLLATLSLPAPCGFCDVQIHAMAVEMPGTRQPEDQQKCLTGLATTIIATRDCLGSLPTRLSLTFPCLALPWYKHQRRHPVHPPFDMHCGLCPRPYNTLAEANIGEIGVLQTSLRSGMAYIPQGISSRTTPPP